MTSSGGWKWNRWHVDHENRRNYFTAKVIGHQNDEKFKTKDEAVRFSQLVMQLLLKENQNDDKP